MLPEPVLKRQISDKGRLAEVTFIVNATCLHMSTGKEVTASLIDLLCKVLEVIVGALVDNRTKIGIALGGVTNDEIIRDLFEPRKQFIINRLFHDYARSRGALLSLQPK